MVRSYWIGPLFGALAVTGLVQGQTPTPAVPAQASNSTERYVIVGDLGKPGQKCRVLKTWTMANGNSAYQVQAVDTGELMTIEEAESVAKSTPGAVAQPRTTHVILWGSKAQAAAPHGGPEPPANAVVLAQPIKVHSPTPAPAPALAAKAPEKAPGKWPAAYVTTNPGDAVPPASEAHLAPMVKKIEPNLAPSAPMVVKTLQPMAAPVAKNVELAPMPPTLAAPTPVALTPAAPKAVAPRPVALTLAAPKPAPVASTVVVPNNSPYNPSSTPTPAVKAPEAVPANSNFWTATSIWKPSSPPQAPAKTPEPAIVKAPPAPVVKVETTNAQPSDWRESWGKIPPPKPAPVHTEERVTIMAAPKVEITQAAPNVETPKAVANVETPKAAPKVEITQAAPKVETPKAAPKVEITQAVPKVETTKAAPNVEITKAAPKVELPHAVVSEDDPLKTPEKFTDVPNADDGAFGGTHTKEAKRPFLAMFASNSPAQPAAKSEEKKPESPTAVVTTAAVPPPPVPVAAAEIAAPTVKIPPPALAQLTPLAAAKAAAPVAAEVKPAAAPTPPLGMQSVLAAQSPELAQPIPNKPVGASQAQAMGLDPNEANAFTEPSPGGKAAVASNGFWAPTNAAPAANYQPETTMWRTAARPAGSPPLALTPSDAVPVTQAGYRQEVSPELFQLSVVMRESLYPSQREWAADRLAAIDWRRQPQALELLIERAKQDAAPSVRAECLRSLARMKCDAPIVVEAVKSCQSDADQHVRQTADDALAKLGASSR